MRGQLDGMTRSHTNSELGIQSADHFAAQLSPESPWQLTVYRRQRSSEPRAAGSEDGVAVPMTNSALLQDRSLQDQLPAKGPVSADR